MNLQHVVILASLSTVAHCVIEGQKYSITRVPFIFYGEGWAEGNRQRFSGVILTERFVLTLSIIPRRLKNITILVGVANVERHRSQGQTFHIRKYKWSDQMALLEVAEAPIIFNERVQRAVRLRGPSWKPGYRVHTAGWGSVNWFNTFQPQLHYMVGYVLEYKNTYLTDFFYLRRIINRKLALLMGNGDIGAPCWDPETNELLGFFLKMDLVAGKHYPKYVFFGMETYWIEWQIPNWEDTTTVTASTWAD